MTSWYGKSLKKTAQSESNPEESIHINAQFFRDLAKSKISLEECLDIFSLVLMESPANAPRLIGRTWGDLVLGAKRALKTLIETGPSLGMSPQAINDLRAKPVDGESKARSLIFAIMQSIGAETGTRNAPAIKIFEKLFFDAVGVKKENFVKTFKDYAPLLAEPVLAVDVDEPMLEKDKSEARDRMLDRYNRGEITKDQMRNMMSEFARSLNGINKTAARMTYPYYVAQTREGRFKGQYPSEIQFVPDMKRMWDQGKLGNGTTMREFRSSDFRDLLGQLRSAGFNPRYDAEIYIIRRDGAPRERVRGNELDTLLRGV